MQPNVFGLREWEWPQWTHAWREKHVNSTQRDPQLGWNAQPPSSPIPQTKEYTVGIVSYMMALKSRYWKQKSLLRRNNCNISLFCLFSKMSEDLGGNVTMRKDSKSVSKHRPPASEQPPTQSLSHHLCKHATSVSAEPWNRDEIHCNTHGWNLQLER